MKGEEKKEKTEEEKKEFMRRVKETLKTKPSQTFKYLQLLQYLQ